MTYVKRLLTDTGYASIAELEHAIGDREEWKMATRRACAEDRRRLKPS